eukprot:763512-Hanusia_phi.AAC.1
MLEDVQNRGRIVDNIPAGQLLLQLLEEEEEDEAGKQQDYQLVALRVLDGIGRNSCFSDHPDSSRISHALIALLAAWKPFSSSWRESLAAKAAETAARISMRRSGAIAVLESGKMEELLRELLRTAEHASRVSPRAKYAIAILLGHWEVSEEAARQQDRLLFDRLVEQVRQQLVGEGCGRGGGARSDGGGAEGLDEAAGAMVRHKQGEGDRDATEKREGKSKREIQEDKKRAAGEERRGRGEERERRKKSMRGGRGRGGEEGMKQK